MIYLQFAAVIIILFSLFAVIHSILASNKIKRFLKKKTGRFFPFYRLAYNLFAIISFILVYLLMPKPGLVIYDLQEPFNFIMFGFQILSLAGLFWTAKYFSLGEFAGFNQIKRWADSDYNEELDEKLTLIIKGPYRFVRHPGYLFVILFLAFKPEVNLFYLIFFILITAYFFIGSHFEEKKLIERFGQKYSDYKKTVPRIFPHIPLKPYKEKI